MAQNRKENYTGKVQAIIAAPSCCKELKAAAEAWLQAAGTDQEQAASEALVKEIEEDVMPIDGLVAFAESPVADQIFGAGAAGFRAHAKELKASGAKYCDCPACAAGAAILAEKDAFLA